MQNESRKTRSDMGCERVSDVYPNRSEREEHIRNERNRQAGAVYLPDGRASAPIWVSAPGQRRDMDGVQAVPLIWPSGQREQFRVFDAWHEIAMQLVDRAGRPFRLMAVYRRVMFWKTGVIFASDCDLSRLAGRCSAKTMSREIQVHRRLGIIAVEHGWREVGGRSVRTRLVKLAVPDPFPAGISLDETAIHMDTRVSTSKPVDRDTCVSNPSGHTGVRSLLSHEGGSDAA